MNPQVKFHEFADDEVLVQFNHVMVLFEAPVSDSVVYPCGHVYPILKAASPLGMLA